MRADRANQAIAIFTMLVALSVAVALAAFVWHLTDLFGTPEQGQVTAVTRAQNLDVGPAIALAPFGQADSRFAPPTTMALQLRGVLLTVPRGRSTALIAPPGGVPVAYAIGQPVPGGGTIEDIGVDRVLLRVNGRIERLDLPRVSTATASPSPSGARQIQPLGTAMFTSVPTTAPPRPIAALFETIPAMPAQGGYRVGAPLSPNARQAGLQPGDLIERINGMPANNLTADRTQLAALLASGYAQVGVLRGERRLSLSFPFR